jgi:hypothetical protein
MYWTCQTAFRKHMPETELQEKGGMRYHPHIHKNYGTSYMKLNMDSQEPIISQKAGIITSIR